MVSKNPSFLITGPSKSGKSTLCLEILNHIQNHELSAGGVITILNTVRCFYLIQSEEKISFEAKNHESSVSIGKFRISEKNMQLALQHISSGQDCAYLFIDEIGILEMDGKGYFPVLETALTRPQGNIIVLRESIFDDFLSEFSLKFDYEVLRCSFGKNQSLLNQVKRKIDKTSQGK